MSVCYSRDDSVNVSYLLCGGGIGGSSVSSELLMFLTNTSRDVISRDVISRDVISRDVSR